LSISIEPFLKEVPVIFIFIGPGVVNLLCNSFMFPEESILGAEASP
jgi:hypothetical protein